MKLDAEILGKLLENPTTKPEEKDFYKYVLKQITYKSVLQKICEKAGNAEFLEKERDKVIKAIAPLQSANEKTKGNFSWEEHDLSKQLPEGYLVFLIFRYLLNFKTNGRMEKILWSCDLDYNGRFYLLIKRKSGFHILGDVTDQATDDIEQIIRRLKKGIKSSKTFLKFIASEIGKTSEVIIKNHSGELFDRYEFFLEQHKYKKEISSEEKNKQPKMVYFNDFLQEEKEACLKKIEEENTEILEDRNGKKFCLWKPISRKKDASEQSMYYAYAAIEAFFSWLEHIFILIYVLKGKIKSGSDILEFLKSKNSWELKYKKVFDIQDKNYKKFHDAFRNIRKNIRNIEAHGHIGAQGQNFYFASPVGSISLRPYASTGGNQFFIDSTTQWSIVSTLETMRAFVQYFKTGSDSVAYYFIKSGYNLSLDPMMRGRYTKGMKSFEAMERLLQKLSKEQENFDNMDW